MSAKTRMIMMSFALLVGVSLVGCGEGSVFEPPIVDTSDRELLPDESNDPRERRGSSGGQELDFK